MKEELTTQQSYQVDFNNSLFLISDTSGMNHFSTQQFQGFHYVIQPFFVIDLMHGLENQNGFRITTDQKNYICYCNKHN
ncbi:unnamed protein product [Paramecium primaurelia]|uniref:Uncharacterized protein n=1 Tax=Paramecium primaurelia TaxID=5886 RepID=A0A8S1KTV7_PARPR|nr:unnamed protein product [Paramecium primaurelia]